MRWECGGLPRAEAVSTECLLHGGSDHRRKRVPEMVRTLAVRVRRAVMCLPPKGRSGEGFPRRASCLRSKARASCAHVPLPQTLCSAFSRRRHSAFMGLFLAKE